MASADNGLVAAAYSPCEARTRVRDTVVHISEETDYPFRGTVRITKLDPGVSGGVSAAAEDSRDGRKARRSA